MTIYTLVITNLKQYFKSPKGILATICIPTTFIIFLFANRTSYFNNINIGIVSEDNSSNSIVNEIIYSIDLKNEIININSKDQGLKLLYERNIDVLYIFPKDFTKSILNNTRPIVESNFIESSTLISQINLFIDNYITNILKDNISNLYSNNITTSIEESSDNMRTYLSIQISLLCYIMFLVALVRSCEIFEMKKYNVLSRMLYTPYLGKQILASMYITTFIVQSIAISFTVILAKVIFKFDEINLFNALCYINAIAFLASTFNVFAMRIGKNENMVSLFTLFYAISSYFLAILGSNLIDTFTTSNRLINILGNFSPFYWCITGIYNNILFPNVIIIIGMGLVFLTAGKFDINELLK